MRADQPHAAVSIWAPPSVRQLTPLPPPADPPAGSPLPLRDVAATDGQSAGGDGVSEVAALPGHRSRLLAVALDLGVVVTVCAVAAALGMVTGLSRVGFVIVAILVWIYFLGATAWLMDGQTAGKMIVGLRVRRSDGRPIPRTLRGVAWSIGRHSLAYLVADVMFLGTGIALGDRRRRCLHDFAFGSEVVQVDVGTSGLGSFRSRYRAYWETFEGEYELLTARNRWFFWPWQWLSRGVVVAAVVVGKLLPAAPPTAVAPATNAPSVGAAGKAAIWTATTITTGAMVIIITPPPPPEVVDLTGTWTLKGVESDSSDVFQPLDFEGVQLAFEPDGDGFRVTAGPEFLLDTYVEPTRVDEDGVLARSRVRHRADCVRIDSGSLIAADAYATTTTWVLYDLVTAPGEQQPSSFTFDYTLDGRKDTDDPAAATCPEATHSEARATAVLDAE